MKICALALFAVFVLLLVGRTLTLRRKGVRAIIFNSADKTDLACVPFYLLILYTIPAYALGLPYPEILSRPLFEHTLVGWLGVAACFAGLVGFALTLLSFGEAFRIGVDKTMPGKLVTGGMFGLSRNPLYVSLVLFYAGLFLVFPTAVLLLILLLFTALVYRQTLKEEAFLEAHYGREYLEYRNKVRRYL